MAISLNPINWFSRQPSTNGHANGQTYRQAVQNFLGRDTPAETYRQWGVPGPSRGILERLRQTVGGWLGPRLSHQTDQGWEVTREKARSGPPNVIWPWFLPYHDGDYTHETGAIRIAYRRMFANPEVKTALLGKIFGVASLDLRVLPADKKKDKDKDIAKHVEWMLRERVRGCVSELMWAVLSGGLIDGYSVCEKVLTLEDRGRYAGKYSLAALKPKDVDHDLVLQTDDHRNVVGLMGLRYNAGIEMSPADFLIYRHLPLYDSPTGSSDLRAAYGSYWMLDTVYKLRAMFAEKRAVPVVVGHFANPTIKAALDKSLALVKSQNWLSIPEAARVEALNLAGAAESDFKSFVQDLTHRIFLGIQGAVLQSLEGDTTDGRGNSQVHRSTADLFVWYLSQCVEALFNDHESGLIRDLVDLNYVVAEYPKVRLTAVDVNELAQEMTIDTGLHQLGLDLSKDELYDRYGRTPPEEDDDKLPGAQSGPGAGPGGGDGGGGGGGPKPSGLPFADDRDAKLYKELDDLMGRPKMTPAGEEPAHPFRRFSDEWRDYLAG